MNGKYKTREITGRRSEGSLCGVDLAPGLKEQVDGSYRLESQADSFIEFPNNEGLDIKDSTTILFCMHPQATDGPIFRIKSSNPSSIHIRMESGKLVAEFTGRNHQCTKLTTDQPLPLNQWHHVGSSYDQNTGMASLWLNGQQVEKKYIGDGMHVATQDNVRVGATGDGGPYFKGRITAMEIYNVALRKKQMNVIGKGS